MWLVKGRLGSHVALGPLLFDFGELGMAHGGELLGFARRDVATDRAFGCLDLNLPPRGWKLIQNSEFLVAQWWVKFSEQLDCIETGLPHRLDFMALDRFEGLENIYSELDDVVLTSRRHRVESINADLLCILITALD